MFSCSNLLRREISYKDKQRMWKKILNIIHNEDPFTVNLKLKNSRFDLVQDLATHLFKLIDTLPSLDTLIKQRNFLHRQKEATTAKDDNVPQKF